MHHSALWQKLVVLSAFILLQSCSEQASSANTQVQAQLPLVSTSTLALQKIDYSLRLPGRVSPFRQSQVRPQVDGVITKRLFEEGALVEQGQQLYQIDDARYKAQLNSALADLKGAKANLKTMKAKSARYKDLVAKSAVSEQEYDDIVAQTEEADAQISIAEAAVAVAQVNLDYTKVYAPIEGRISRSYVTEGALVTTNQSQQLATITQLNPVYVDMQESGKGVLEMRQEMQQNQSMPVSIILDELSGERYEHQGVLKFSEVTVDQSTGAVTLRAILPNPDGVLLPGLFVKASIDMGAAEGLLIPQRATMRQPDGALSVYSVGANNEVELHTISPSRAIDDNYVLTKQSTLQSGDMIIVTGYQKVKPGMKVNTVQWQGGASSSRASASQL